MSNQPYQTARMLRGGHAVVTSALASAGVMLSAASLAMPWVGIGRTAMRLIDLRATPIASVMVLGAIGALGALFGALRGDRGPQILGAVATLCAMIVATLAVAIGGGHLGRGYETFMSGSLMLLLAASLPGGRGATVAR